jgi:hypothetical protein
VKCIMWSSMHFVNFLNKYIWISASYVLPIPALVPIPAPHYKKPKTLGIRIRSKFKSKFENRSEIMIKFHKKLVIYVSEKKHFFYPKLTLLKITIFLFLHKMYLSKFITFFLFIFYSDSKFITFPVIWTHRFWTF